MAPRSGRLQGVLLVLCCWGLFAAAFKGGDFKKCNDAAFCKRLRTQQAANYTIDAASAKLGSDGVFVASLVNTDDDVAFTLSIAGYKNGVLRFHADEPKVARRRFQVPDVLMPEVDSAAARKPLTLKHLPGSKGVQLALGDVAADLLFAPFQLTVFDSQDVLFEINARQLFHIEHQREKKEGDPEGWWEESFKTHKDTKQYGPQALSLDLDLPSHTHVFGIPEHATSFALQPTVGFNLTSEPYRLYNLDVFEYDHESPFGLYGSVPFLVGHNTRRTVGAFWLNAAEMYVDIGEHPRTGGTTTQWIAESGVLDLFLLLGPTPAEVTSQYAWLTGPTALPQLFAIAYHQCRWNYRDEEDCKQVDAGFDKHGIPYDVLWLDIEHTDGKRYMTWDANYFPTPEALQLDLASRGRKTVTIIDPHMKRDAGYPVFKDAETAGHFVKTHDGKDFDGWCWPGSSSYLDVVNPAVRSWWAGMFSTANYKGSTKHLYVWNDMNEPSVFNGPEITMHKDNLHYLNAEHRDVHNTYGYFYHMATADGLRRRGLTEVGPDGDRPFVLSRAFFSGTQRVGPIWTGDNTADWDHLRVSIPMLLSIGLTGVTFSGADVGGFFGNPDAELMTRWYQLGAYYPFFRGHAHLETKRREPWLFGDEATARIRAAIRGRYALLPYMYTMFRHANTSGSPVLRPLWYEFPGDVSTLEVEDEFMVGPALLLAPVLNQGAAHREVDLPRGAAWYDYTTGVRAEPPAASSPSSAPPPLVVPVTLDSVPAYLRGGSILARRDRPRRSTAAMRHDPLTLVVALDPASGTAEGDLYMDDGASYAFQRGEYLHRRFRYEAGVLSSSVLPGSGGAVGYDPHVLIGKVVVLGLQGGPSGWKVVLRGEAKELGAGPGPLTFEPEQPDSALVVRNPRLPVAKDWELVFRR